MTLDNTQYMINFRQKLTVHNYTQAKHQYRISLRADYE